MGWYRELAEKNTSLLFENTRLDSSDQSMSHLFEGKDIRLVGFWKPLRLREKVLDYRDSVKVHFLQGPMHRNASLIP